MRNLLTAASIALAVNVTPSTAHADQWCRHGYVTAYSAEQFPGRTYSGTSTTQAVRDGRNIVAASWTIPIGATVVIDGDEYTVEDRGLLDEHGILIDVLMPTTRDALRHGKMWQEVCVVNDN